MDGQNNKIIIENQELPISDNDFEEVCESLRKRVIRILFLKDDLIENKITEYDLNSYLNALIWDFYGTYLTFNNYKFINCICELEGIKQHLYDEFTRKKVLDLANFVSLIVNKKE